MKADGLFVIMAIVFIFIAWVATGGPTRPIATAGPFITPVTRPGEESQGYRFLVPTNPIDTSSYPKQIPGSGSTISGGKDLYTRSDAGKTSASSDTTYLERSTLGPASGNPNQEYVRIVHSGGAPLSISGWRLRSKATGESVTIPQITLSKEQTLVVVSGRAEAGQLQTTTICAAGAVCVFLNRNLEVYALTRETITLLDANNKIVDSFSY